MADEIVEKKRKPKRSQLMKKVRWARTQVYNGMFPVFRYGVIPAMIAYSIMYTEPTPTFWELVNPLF